MSLLQKMFGKRQKRTHPYCAALIAAAGSSTRYGGENKLLQTLDGIPVLVRTLLTIDRVEGIDEIVIAAREDELLPYAELCKTFGLRKPVKVIVGGATRTESVLRAALEASPETEFFAVQDGARPLVTVELIDEVLDAARVYLAAAPAVPVRDTIKVAHDGIVERTPDRSALFAVQTPQVFRRDSYLAAYALALRGGKQFTDETGLLEAAGFAVEYVDAPRMNIKLTTAEDVQLARAYAALLRTQAQKDAEQEAFPPSV